MLPVNTANINKYLSTKSLHRVIDNPHRSIHEAVADYDRTTSKALTIVFAPITLGLSGLVYYMHHQSLTKNKVAAMDELMEFLRTGQEKKSDTTESHFYTQHIAVGKFKLQENVHGNNTTVYINNTVSSHCMVTSLHNHISLQKIISRAKWKDPTLGDEKLCRATHELFQNERGISYEDKTEISYLLFLHDNAFAFCQHRPWNEYLTFDGMNFLKQKLNDYDRLIGILNAQVKYGGDAQKWNAVLGKIQRLKTSTEQLHAATSHT